MGCSQAENIVDLVLNRCQCDVARGGNGIEGKCGCVIAEFLIELKCLSDVKGLERLTWLIYPVLQVTGAPVLGA